MYLCFFLGLGMALLALRALPTPSNPCPLRMYHLWLRAFPCQTEAVLRRRVRTPAGRGAEPCGVARQNTEDRRKGRARCGCKEAMLKSCRRGAHHSGFCCNSPARPQRQWVLITASAANQPRGGNKKAKKLQFLHTAPPRYVPRYLSREISRTPRYLYLSTAVARHRYR